MRVLKNRYGLIKKYVKNKDVLDLGVVCHNINEEQGEEWLHKFIKRYSKSLLGVDYMKREVELLQKKGYNVVCGNVETIKLNKKFDVIVAGELIEHLSNQGIFLDNMQEHLKEDGVLILTTPHGLTFRNAIRSLIFGTVPTNKEHTCWHTPKTLKQLLIRHKYHIVSLDYFFDDPKTFKSRVNKILSKLNKHYTPQIIAVAKKFEKNKN